MLTCVPKLIGHIQRRLALTFLRQVLKQDHGWRSEPFTSAQKRLIFIVGAESTGTRVLADLLSQHPDLYGTSDAPKHHDALDETWRHLNRDDLKAALKALPDLSNHRGLITRRSLPHGDSPGVPAQFMRFANLRGLLKLARAANLDPIVLITSRSPAANLASWTCERSSAQRQLDNAMKQYLHGYRHVFALLAVHHVPFLVLSLEGLTLDGPAYIRSVFQLCGLPPMDVSVEQHPQVNRRRYEWFARQPDASF